MNLKRKFEIWNSKFKSGSYDSYDGYGRIVIIGDVSF